MKRAISLLLALILCFCLCACSNSTAALETETLELLNSAYSYCHTGMVYMLRAWDFSVQHSTDSTRDEYEALWELFGGHMAMSEDDMVDALINGCGFTLDDLSLYNDASKGLNTTVNGMLFMKAGYSVPVAKYAFMQRNAGVNVDDKLEQIKANLQEIGEKSKAYELLKEYYLMVCEMSKWIESPDGSYSSTSSNLDSYEKNSENFKQELDLIIG